MQEFEEVLEGYALLKIGPSGPNYNIETDNIEDKDINFKMILEPLYQDFFIYILNKTCLSFNGFMTAALD